MRSVRIHRAGSHLPPGATLFDLKIYDGLTSWFGRVRIREDLAKLLPYSGEAGLFIRPKRSAVREEVCWYPDGESNTEAALKDAKKYGGRVVANRRGLGIDRSRVPCWTKSEPRGPCTVSGRRLPMR